MLIPGPRTYGSGTDSDGLVQYARAIQEALSIGSYIYLAIHIPMYGQHDIKEMTGDLLPFGRVRSSSAKGKASQDVDLYENWDTWNLIRDVCKYNSRLSVGKRMQPFRSIFPHLLNTLT